MQDEEEGLSKEIETLKRLNKNFHNECLNKMNNSEKGLINRWSRVQIAMAWR